MTKRNSLRAATAVLAALLVCMIVLNIARSEELEAARLRINAVYEKAFYETCELTEAISANYRKLLVAGDGMQMQVLLGEISRQTQGAAGNLALLPLGEETVSATIKFINQAEDFAETLSAKIAGDEEVSEADYAAMETLSESAAEFSVGLIKLLERFENGEAVFDAEDFTETGDETLYPLTGDAAQYPVLLYDGPFSDGEATGDYPMLKGAKEFSQAEAEAKLKAYIPAEEIRYTGSSHPEVDCYEFQLMSDGVPISAGVTRQGGHILYLLPETGVNEAKLDAAALCDMARAFLISRSYGPMEMSYYSAYGGILTINFAAVQDGVILYPDLLKLQLSMETGQVIGLDAHGYLRCHRERSIPAPALTAEEAMQRVSPRLKAANARLCIIPQNNAEYLCYEIAASDSTGEFLVYVDAQTGVERDLMQVISRDNGTLVM